MIAEHDCGCRNDTECAGCQSEYHADSLASAVRAIAHGGVDGPTGLEVLTMAISGSGSTFDRNLCAAIGDSGDGIAEALTAVADGLNNVAQAIQGLSSNRSTDWPAAS